jgi:hypothetical protein
MLWITAPSLAQLSIKTKLPWRLSLFAACTGTLVTRFFGSNKD